MTSSCEIVRVFHCFTFVILSIVKWMQLNDLPAVLRIGFNSMITIQLLFWHENQLSATDHVLSGSRVSVNDISLHSNATVGVDSRFQIVPQGIRAINDKITWAQLRLLIRKLQLRRQTYFCAAQLELIVIQEVAYAAPASLNHEWHAKYLCLVKNEKWAWHLSHNRNEKHKSHYNDAIRSAMASQITSLAIIYSTVCSAVYQRKHQRSASLAFVRGIHWWPVNSLHKWSVTCKMFPFDDVIMTSGICQELSTWIASGRVLLWSGNCRFSMQPP